MSSRYFAAFDDDIKNGFYFSFAQWELESILEELTNAGILSSTGTPTSKPLSNVPPAIVYNMVSNITVLRDRRILSAIMAAPLSEPLPGWPTDPIPPGLLILLLNKNEKVRQWALRHTSICRTVPIATEAFSESYKLVLEAMVPAFSANTHVPHPNPNEAIQTTIVADPNVLWQSFKEVMRFIPSRFLTCSSSLAVDIRRMVTGHLHDTGGTFSNPSQSDAYFNCPWAFSISHHTGLFQRSPQTAFRRIVERGKPRVSASRL